MSIQQPGKEQRSLLSSQSSLLILFILALALRIFCAFYGPTMMEYIFSDMKGYISIADQVLSGIWKVTHFFQSIGYPMVIAFLKRFFDNWSMPLGILQALLSFLTLIPIYLLSERCFGKKTAMIALLIASVHVPWVLFSNLALPETIFTFCLSLSAWFSFKLISEEKPSLLYAFGWAIFFMMAFWLKGTHVFWAPLFLTGMLIYRKKAALPAVILISVTMALSLSLHGWLTHSKIGKIQLSASTGGLNFIEGKCPLKDNKDSLSYSWISPLYYQLDMQKQKLWDRPFTDSSYFMQQGFKCIQANPFILVQSLESIPFLFFGNLTWPLNQMPKHEAIRLYELYFSIFLLCGFLLFARQMATNRDLKHFLIWGLPVMALFLCVYIFKSEVRYRIPFDIWLIPMAVQGLRNLRITYFDEEPASHIS
ncbi:MAG TPA: glycosyltransferase family 39 protein [Bacteriovoracaceae bacterium]|nr:glycosyltransferase family 39 protein [Bacteriovoracaceae bacterium]